LKKEIGSNSNIFLLGLQNNPYKFVAKADAFVFTSLWEGFPNVLIESLAC
jgi:N-acetylgalactosamine-N,N'-diacetylbacillosaminyl-diphospho-undecaprenol 4-alpha-N-acetylgalactosaminyltransferase